MFSIQIAAAATIPKEMGGLDGATIYIDTHNGVFLDRVKMICGGVVKKCHESARNHNLGKYFLLFLFIFFCLSYKSFFFKLLSL